MLSKETRTLSVIDHQPITTSAPISISFLGREGVNVRKLPISVNVKISLSYSFWCSKDNNTHRTAWEHHKLSGCTVQGHAAILTLLFLCDQFDERSLRCFAGNQNWARIWKTKNISVRNLGNELNLFEIKTRETVLIWNENFSELKTLRKVLVSSFFV